MAEERSKSDFCDILNNIDRKFEIIHVKWSDEKFFEIKFRTQIERSNEDFNSLCDEWVDLFSDVTNTVWAKKISNTGPKIRFRKQYQCWTQGGKIIQKELLFDARRCKGTLDMKVLTDNPLTRRKNKHIKLGLNVVVKINFTHLHRVDTSQPFAFFVHTCEPQPEAPKPVIRSNEKLPQLIAEIVQKGINASSKAATQMRVIENQQQIIMQSCQKQTPPQITHDLLQHSVLVAGLEDKNNEHNLSNDTLLPPQQLIQDSIHIPGFQQPTIQVLQSDPLSLEGMKLDLQPQLQQYTQVVVSSPQVDLEGDSLLMCQPLMFETSQLIPVSSQFVQLSSHNLHNQQGQFL